jgi:hypothetical protein
MEPKTLRGSGQNRHAVGYSTLSMEYADLQTAGAEAGAKSFVSLKPNVVNPTFRPGGGAGASARNALGMAGRGCWKKPRPFCNGADRDCHIIPPCKRADFQRVIRDERTGRTFMGGNRK